ncbi:helix-turn-helix domain-containing protein [Arthrobacter hankyongi]|uniref:helix-turn-helix domain-containing protein n=1 Tax=Arthrobacter hankyongi TaxID=2904801 RepID=UPI0027E02040|nr:helix-turn-helix transcriptional regulator [Arthrobacter hankyongi]
MSDRKEEQHRITCHLDEVLQTHDVTLTELSRRTGITMANLSILKTNKAKAIRFSTLTAICEALDTSPAELFSFSPDQSFPAGTQKATARIRH